MAVLPFQITPEQLRIAEALGRPALATGQAAQAINEASQMPVSQGVQQYGSSNPVQEATPQVGSPTASRAVQLAQTQAAANPTPQAQSYTPVQDVNQPLNTQNTQQQQNTQQTQQSMPTQSSIGGSQNMQQGSALGGPSNLDPNVAKAGAQGNNTQAEQNWWDTMVKNFVGPKLTPEDYNNPEKVSELNDWRNNASMASLLTSLGSNVANDHWVGRFGSGMNEFIRGGLRDKNARAQENSLGKQITTAGKAMQGSNNSNQSGSQAPIKQPTASGYQTTASNTYGMGSVQPNKESLLAQIRALGVI